MIYNLDDVQNMFEAADKIIIKNPQILQKTTDEIFDELDDGTKEMIHNRWGVMVRAKMQELKSLEYQDIIDFLLNIKERNLLCEYIGYVLQNECKISLLKLLIESYKKGVANDIIPFVEQCIEYEEECYVQDIDVILGILQGDNEQKNKYPLVHGYAFVVVRTNSEDAILEKYIAQYSKELESLVSEIGVVLFKERKEDADKWLGIYLYGDNDWCKTMGIEYLYKSIFYDNLDFEKNFEFIENNFLDHKFLWEKLIPVFVQYILNKNNSMYRDSVKKQLISIKHTTQNEKRICLQMLEYCGIKSRDGIEIIEEIISMPFQRNVQILQCLDYYFAQTFDENYLEAIEKLYKLYVINEYSTNEDFLEKLPQTCSALNKQQQNLFAFWYDKFISGNIFEFFLSIEIFEKLISVEEMESFLKLNNFLQGDLISLVDGVLLFSIDEKKIASLTFTIADCIKSKDSYFSYCIDNIYANYSGALLNVANDYIKDPSEFKADLAKRIIEYNRIYREKMMKGYADKDFMPTMERRLIYQRLQVEKNREINEAAEQQSFMSQIFQSRTMKFGKRFGFIQTLKKGELAYQVNGYAHHEIIKELPSDFINDPVKHIYLRQDYLRRRDKDAAHS